MIEDILLPEEFKANISAEMGENIAKTLFSALDLEPDTSLRINRRKRHDTDLYPGMTQVPWCISGYYLDKRPLFTGNPLIHAGCFYVQDASSMIYETIVDLLVDGNPVVACDLCAAPGGKTTAILNAMPDGSAVLANEFNPARAAILKENICKFGYPEVVVTNTDTSRLTSMKEFFGLVAVDAPCSGEGMMRKDDKARAQWSEGLIRQCSALQREIIGNAVEMLAPGGFLIYSTCTFNFSENEDIAEWIAHEFGLTPVDTGLAGKYGIKPQLKGNIPCLRFLPGFTRGEGLFVAVFKKDGDIRNTDRKKSARKNGKGNKKATADSKIIALAKSWINGEPEILNHDGHLLALTPATKALLNAIPQGVHIISVGIEIGEIKGKDLIPAHPLAMSTIMKHPFPEVELTEEAAIAFLSRETVSLPAETPKGFVTMTFKGHPLGFMKNHGNRANNLYPLEWRIRDRELLNKTIINQDHSR